MATPPHPTAPAPTAADVIVIGAGLAGLAAADRLRSSREVIVLEAADRLGGRSYGRHWAAAGRDIDMGGTWLLPAFSTAFGLLAEFGIGTYDSPVSDRWLTHFRNGIEPRERLDSSERADLLRGTAALREAIESRSAPITAAEALERTDLTPLSLDWHLATQRYLVGAPLDLVDAGHLLIADDDLLDPEHYATQITGTTRALVESLADRSGARIETGRPVVGVSTTGSGYLVTSAEGAAWSAPEVIVAAPRNVLAGIRFDGGVPRPLAELAEAPHVGASRKDWFVLDGVDEHFRVFASAGPFGYFRSEARLPDGGMLAVGLAPSSEGMPTLPEFEAAMQPYLPGVRVRAHERHDWLGDPWARGTWLGPRPGDYARNAGLVPQLGTLQFVGGDLCTEFPGTLEGALRTGIAAADRVAARSSASLS